MQEHVEKDCVGGIVVPLILYSDQTALSKNRRTIGHPLVLSIGNIACENRYRDEGHSMIATLPIPQTNASSSVERLRVFQECLEVVLKPLKDASFE